MLPPDPAKLEPRAGRRLDGDRGLGDRDHPAIGDEQGGAGEADPTPERRHAVELFGCPAEKRRLVAPAVGDEPLQAVLGLSPPSRQAVRRRQSALSRGLAASRPARTRRKSGLAAARMATTSGGGAAAAW